MNAKPKIVSAATADLARRKARAAAFCAAQLNLFDCADDPVVLDKALQAADQLEAVTAAIVANTPALAAQLADPRAKEKLDFARFMRAATTPHEVVQQALAQSEGAEQAAAVMQQLAAVEDAEAALRADGAIDDQGAGDEEEPDEIDEDVDQDGEAQTSSGASVEDTRGASTTDLHIAKLRTSRYAPLTPEREAELGRLSMAGNIAARHELIEHNMRFAVSMARRYIKTGRPFDDLIQAACEGLMTAADKFNPDLGRFTTLAGWWVRQSIQRAVRKDDTMPTPSHLPGLAAKLRRQAEAATSEPERARLLSKADGAAQRLEMRRKGTVSLDQRLGGEEDGADMLSMIASEEPGHDERAEQARLVNKIMELSKRLGDERSTNIFLMRVGMHPQHLGDALSLGEISEEFHLTRERVRQIYTEAADDIATAMEYWAKGADNLPAGFRKTLMHPGRA